MYLGQKLGESNQKSEEHSAPREPVGQKGMWVRATKLKASWLREAKERLRVRQRGAVSRRLGSLLLFQYLFYTQPSAQCSMSLVEILLTTYVAGVQSPTMKWSD